MAAGPISERNQDATIYVGGLDEKVNESLLWELFVQAGPVVNVHMPKDRVTMAHQGYGFVEFLGEDDADYSIKIMNMIKLYGKPIRVNKASAHQKNLDVGANIFIGNLDPEVDEKLLYDTFSAFGVILTTPKIQRDPDTGNSKGFAFINYASFEASDAAIEAMNGQYLCNRAISISYAFKKDSKGERHGSAAERLLAAQNPLSQADRPHQLFADAPPTMPPPPPAGGGLAVPPPPPGMMLGMPPGMPPPPVPPPGGMPPLPPGPPGSHPMPSLPPPPPPGGGGHHGGRPPMPFGPPPGHHGGPPGGGMHHGGGHRMGMGGGGMGMHHHHHHNPHHHHGMPPPPGQWGMPPPPGMHGGGGGNMGGWRPPPPQGWGPPPPPRPPHGHAPPMPPGPPPSR